MTKREYLYTVLMEEAAEVSQAASKIMRFGEQAYCPADEEMKNNAQSLLEEYCHLRAAIFMLQEAGYLPTLDTPKMIGIEAAKEAKVTHYMNEYLNFALNQEGISP